MTIACALDESDRPQRRGAWSRLVATATAMDEKADGVQLTFDRDADVVAIARLAAAENDCCRFFTFTLRISDVDVRLDVTAPAPARGLVDDLLGVLR